MAGLVVKDKIEVETSNGVREIQLCYGSVTKISRENAVDVLVLSAFPGDYSATPTSVIGALWRDLKVSVRELARNKEEDLRSIFSCWWSKKLPSGLHFKRLLCFEGAFKQGSRPPMVVSEVFRCLVSMCKQKEITAMMPLLGAGDQGYSKQLMLRLMVNAAIHWMQAGLPLKVLKIVVYHRHPYEEDVATDPLLLYFQELKSKWLAENLIQKTTPAPVIKYDVYLSFSPTDEETAVKVRQMLISKQESIRIFDVKQEVNADESFQEEIYQVMVSCARVVTLLSPHYLQDASCVEQYNIALCCTRNVKRDYLAPFYIDTIERMPTYMCLVQYVDCRPPECPLIQSACGIVVDWLETNVSSRQGALTDGEKQVKKPVAASTTDTTYDVFISYAHATKAAATHVVQTLRRMCPDLRVFVDTDVLTVGDSWQIKLFESIEASNVVVALLSTPYLQSTVCQEEFNLAYGLHCDHSYKTRLLVVDIEGLTSIPTWCAAIKPIVTPDIVEKSNLSDIVNAIRDMLDHPKTSVEDSISLRDLVADWRAMHCFAAFPFFPSSDPRQQKQSYVIDNGESDAFDVVLCYNDADRKSGEFLHGVLMSFAPNARVSLPAAGDNVRFDLIDSTTLVVPLLSTDFVRCPHNMAEFSAAIARHRHEQRLILFPVILDSLPASPAYVHLVWCLYCSLDACWRGHSSYSRVEGPDKRCMKACAVAICECLAGQNALDGPRRALLPPHELHMSKLHFTSNKKDSLPNNPLLYKKFEPSDSIGLESVRPSLMETNAGISGELTDVKQEKEKQKQGKRRLFGIK